MFDVTCLNFDVTHVMRRPDRIVQTHDTIRRTARQWCHEIQAFKERKEKETGENLTVKKLNALYKSPNVTTAVSTKTEMNQGGDFVGDCLKVYDKLLSDHYMSGKLENLERQYGLASCLNNLAKLRIIVEKTETIQQRRWVIGWIVDALSAGGSPPLLTNENVGALRFFVVESPYLCNF